MPYPACRNLRKSLVMRNKRILPTILRPSSESHSPPSPQSPMHIRHRRHPLIDERQPRHIAQLLLRHRLNGNAFRPSSDGNWEP